MIYTLENHELKHAVEEMLFHLLPTETLSRADSAEQLTEPYCRSILTEENGEAAARAIVCMDGAVHEAEKRASVTGLATLDYKRTITELVKTIFRCTSAFRSVRRGAITVRLYRQPRRSPVNSSSRIWTRSAARSRRQPRLSAQRASRCRASTSAAAHRPRWTSISWHGCCRRSKITLIFHICANIL